MTTQTKTPRTFAVVIKEIGHTPNGLKITADIPEFLTEYPTILVVPDDEQAKDLAPGKTYSFVLKQGNLKKKKDGSQYDGSKLWMYWWDYAGRAEDPKTDNGTQASASSHPDSTAYGDAKQASIEGQVALTQARMAAEWLLVNAAPPTEPVTTEFLRVEYAKQVAWFHRAFVKILQGRVDESKL